MIPLIAAAIIAAVGAVTAGVVIVMLSQKVTESVTTWLAGRNLGTNQLTDAWMHLERAGNKFRSTVFFRHRGLYGTYQLVMDELVDPEQIDDPQVRAEALARGAAQTNVKHLFG